IYYSIATEPSNRLFMEEMNFVVKNHFSELSVGACKGTSLIIKKTRRKFTWWDMMWEHRRFILNFSKNIRH
ncbi:MAG: hypothetical protein WCE93_06935, partial [Nitrososphaeraceae archaeon]